MSEKHKDKIIPYCDNDGVPCGYILISTGDDMVWVSFEDYQKFSMLVEQERIRLFDEFFEIPTQGDANE